MTQRFEHIAVTELETYIAANLGAVITQLNTDESRTGVDALVMPQADSIVREFAPHLTESPLLMIWDEAATVFDDGDRHAYAAVDCTVAFSYTSGGGRLELEDGADRVRLYAAALRRLIFATAGKTLGSTVAAAFWTDSDREVAFISQSQTRHTRAVGVEVHVYDP